MIEDDWAKSKQRCFNPSETQSNFEIIVEKGWRSNELCKKRRNGKRIQDVIDFRLFVSQIKEMEGNFSHLKFRFGNKDGGGFNGGNGEENEGEKNTRRVVELC